MICYNYPIRFFPKEWIVGAKLNENKNVFTIRSSSFLAHKPSSSTKRIKRPFRLDVFDNLCYIKSMRKKRNAYFREYHSKKMKEDSNYREQRKRSWDKWRMSNPEKKKRFQKNWLDKNLNYFKKPGKGYAIKKATAVKRRM